MNQLPHFLSGEMHYPRIPHEYWRHRMQMARFMGLDTVSTYVFWNVHEPLPGTYDFSSQYDLAAYLRTARSAGLRVILRPGPYVCAEWDFGGLPAWLLSDDALRVRTTDERFMTPVRRWLGRLGDEVDEFFCDGTILAVQLENEYGAFGNDRSYLTELRQAYRAAGLTRAPLYTIDQPKDLRGGSLADVPAGVTFPPGEARRGFAALREFRPEQPPICGEYWAGWFDHWGKPRERRDDELAVDDLRWMLQQGASVNIYMFHGGTNFGFWNGANAADDEPYSPDVTSYDYLAAVDEAGRARAKYDAFRDVLSSHNRVATSDTDPNRVKLSEVAPFELAEYASLDALLHDPVRTALPLPMEAIGQYYGYALYRTQLSDCAHGILTIQGLHDYGVVCVDGRVVGHIDRRLGETTIALPAFKGQVTLDVLVENGGRINYGAVFAGERKGITGPVSVNGEPVREWEIYRLPMTDLSALRFERSYTGPIGFLRGTFDVTEPADTFLDVRELGKGTLWINRRHAGRFWRIGPQRSLYVPGVWLRQGVNEVVAFDVEAAVAPKLRGCTEPWYAE